jgi:hypothetical protein
VEPQTRGGTTSEAAPRYLVRPGGEVFVCPVRALSPKNCARLWNIIPEVQLAIGSVSMFFALAKARRDDCRFIATTSSIISPQIRQRHPIKFKQVSSISSNRSRTILPWQRGQSMIGLRMVCGSLRGVSGAPE